MKKFAVIWCILAILLVFAFGACSSPTGGDSGGGPTPQKAIYSGTKDGTTYTLTITQNLNRAYAPQPGDSYVLTIGTEKSSGIVTAFDPGTSTFTLKPTNSGTTFTATVDGTNGLTGLTGTIAMENGTVKQGPGALTSGGGGGDDGGYPGLGDTLYLLGQIYTQGNSDLVPWEPGTNSYTLSCYFSYYASYGSANFSTNAGSLIDANGSLNCTVGILPGSLLSGKYYYGTNGEPNYYAYTNKFNTLQIWNGSYGVGTLAKYRDTLTATENIHEELSWQYIDHDAPYEVQITVDIYYSVTQILPLKKGWNEVTKKTVTNLSTGVVNESYYLGNVSSLQWILKLK